MYLFNNFPQAHSAATCCPLCPPLSHLSRWPASRGPMGLWGGGTDWNRPRTEISEMSMHIGIYILYAIRHAPNARGCCPRWRAPHPLSLWRAPDGPRVVWGGGSECNRSGTEISEMHVYIGIQLLCQFPHAHGAATCCPLWPPMSPLSRGQPRPSLPWSKNSTGRPPFVPSLSQCAWLNAYYIFIK